MRGSAGNARNDRKKGHEPAKTRVDLGRKPPQSLRPPRLAGSLRAAGRRLRRVDHLPHWKGLREEIRSGRRYRYLALRSAERALAFDRQIVAPDSDTVDRFEFLLATLSSGANDRHDVTGVPQRASFLPDAAVEGTGEVFDQDQHASWRAHAPFCGRFVHYQQIPS